jgi:hypothetical protein
LKAILVLFGRSSLEVVRELHRKFFLVLPERKRTVRDLGSETVSLAQCQALRLWILSPTKLQENLYKSLALASATPSRS